MSTKELDRTYTITQAAKLSGLRESTLRYYETIGIIQPIVRDESTKRRVYSQDDVNRIDAIACLNATGMSLDDMRTYLENRHKGAAGAENEIALLQAQQARLEDEARSLAIRTQYVALKVGYWKAVREGDAVLAERIGNDARALAQDLKFTIK